MLLRGGQRWSSLEAGQVLGPGPAWGQAQQEEQNLEEGSG